MSTEKMFELAARNKFRFPYKGQVSVEDIWDLGVEELDKIFKQLNSQVKQATEESLLTTKTAGDEVLAVKIGIIKHIVAVKLAETEAKRQAHEKREQKQKILAIISQKQDSALHDKSVEELTAMLDNL